MQIDVIEVKLTSLGITQDDLFQPRGFVAGQAILAQRLEQLHEVIALRLVDAHGVACVLSWRLTHSSNDRRIRDRDWYTELIGRPSNAATLLPDSPDA